MYSLLTFLMLFLVFCIQEFLSPLNAAASHAQILLFQIWFFCTAVTVSYPVMLALAFFAGFLWDLRHVVDPGEGLSDGGTFGISILLYGLVGCIMQGIRPLYFKKRLFPVSLVAGICVFLLRLLDYLFINFKRGGLKFPRVLLFEMVSSALVTMALAPLILYVLYWLTRSAGHSYRYQDYRR